MRSVNRRAFVKGIGASLGASLLLSPFLDPIASAEGGRRPKRLLLFNTMGTSPGIWTPTSVSGENSFTFSESTSPLAAVKQHLVLVDGLISGNPGNNHGSPDGTTGVGFGASAAISVDQFIADRLISAGVRRPIPSLLLGADSNANGGRTMIWRGDNLSTIASPVSAYTTLFGGAVPSGTSTDTLLRRRRSILDNLKREISAVEGSLGSQQKRKLELHLDSVRQIETRLSDGMTSGGGCTPPASPLGEISNPMNANLVHLDLLVNAFACDLTRVGVIQWGSDQAMHVDLPELNLQGDEHGGFIHSGAPEFRNLIKLEKWLSERFVDVINKLKAIPEADGSGTLFDNTLIAWCRDMGDAPNHNQNSMRFVLASGNGGYLRTNPNGRYMHFNSQSPGERHERVLLSLCDAMGVTDFTGFGDSNLPSSAKTPLPGLSAV
jgi:Protein of unknown function (DUF1552)